VTPLQIVAGVAAIAAGGVYHQPRIVARIVSPDGGVEVPAPLPAIATAAAKTPGA